MTPRIDDRYKLFIDGKWVESACGKSFTTTNPANGETLAVCANACADDIDRAVDAAWDAFHSWKKTSPQERAAMLLKIADLIDANAEHLAMQGYKNRLRYGMPPGIANRQIDATLQTVQPNSKTRGENRQYGLQMGIALFIGAVPVASPIR